MGQKEENWNIALRKAAHKNAMQHVQQPLANKDGIKEVEETSTTEQKVRHCPKFCVNGNRIQL